MLVVQKSTEAAWSLN